MEAEKHTLEDKWTLWFQKQQNEGTVNPRAWLESLKEVMSFGCVCHSVILGRLMPRLKNFGRCTTISKLRVTCRLAQIIVSLRYCCFISSFYHSRCMQSFSPFFFRYALVSPQCSSVGWHYAEVGGSVASTGRDRRLLERAAGLHHRDRGLQQDLALLGTLLLLRSQFLFVIFISFTSLVLFLVVLSGSCWPALGRISSTRTTKASPACI
jgi:hypothetical protein